MSIFDDWFHMATELVNGYEYNSINIFDDNLERAAKDVAQVIPDHYIAPESIVLTLERLGKSAAAKKLRAKLPKTKNIRSGDLGEILATEYINTQTGFAVPIKKLRWHDHREMALRGDDVIGIMASEELNRPRFLKSEAKSRMALGTQIMEDARLALDADGGRPAPHALAFVADRLREGSNIELADIIDEAQWKQGITIQQMEHLLFTFTGSNPNNLQMTKLQGYDGDIKQHAVGLRIKTHQRFIADVFDEVENGLDD